MGGADGLVCGGKGCDPSTCVNNQHTEWTYNQGVVLGGLGLLYEFSGNATLLTVATDLVDATTTTLVYSSGILEESCEELDDCDSDQQQFKGIYVRYLMYLQPFLEDATPTKALQYRSWVKMQSNSIWSKDATSAHDFGLKWVGPVQTPGNTVQTSAMDALVAEAKLSAT